MAEFYRFKCKCGYSIHALVGYGFMFIKQHYDTMITYGWTHS